LSKRRSKTSKRSASQTFFWFLSLIMVASMVISLVIVALEAPPRPTPTPAPTLTPTPRPSLTPTPSPTLEPTTAGPKATATEPTTELDLPAGTPTAEATPAGAGKPLPAAVALAASPSVAATGPGPVAVEEPDVSPSLVATPEMCFAVAGDSRDGPQIYRRVLEMVAADQVEFLIHTGDLVNEGTEAQWSDFEALMVGFPLPFYPVPGNHDALEGRLDGYLAHSGAPAVHYSFDKGTVHFCFADSHHGGVTAAELAWLREDLGATARPLKIVVLHHPPFDPDGSDHIMAFGNRRFMALMAEMDVDYVFAGHIHAYARGEQDGVQYVITGGAGAPLYSTDHPQAVHHYLHVTVLGEDVAVKLVQA
jgi:3',5'-cyclic AMP phosphodiesterase CpdA